MPPLPEARVEIFKVLRTKLSGNKLAEPHGQPTAWASSV